MFGATSEPDVLPSAAFADPAVERRAHRADLHGDRPVLLEGVLGHVGVVADDVGRRDDQLAAEARVAVEARRIGAVPQRRRVALVDGRGVGERERAVDAAGVARDDLVEELRRLGDVDVLAQRLGVLAEVVLADVHRRPPRPVRVLQPVRDVDLAHRDAVDDRTDPGAVLVADVVQDEALAHAVVDAEVPALPAHVAPVDREALTARLALLQGREIGPLGRRRAAGGAVHRAHDRVDDLDHLASGHVHRERAGPRSGGCTGSAACPGRRRSRAGSGGRST